MKSRVLLVEDEKNLLDTIAINLEMEGYEVVKSDNGAKAYDIFKNAKFDLLILDVMLPDLNGFDLCRKIRQENNQVPILFITAKNTGQDRVEGLRIGADDYLTKPFNLEELLLRVKNLLRRNVQATAISSVPDVYIFSEFEINFLTYTGKGLENKQFELSKKEALLLKLLIERKNQVVSRDEILEKVWGYDVYPSSRTIDNYILVFRKYFESNPRDPKFFHSIRGVGYKFMD